MLTGETEVKEKQDKPKGLECCKRKGRAEKSLGERHDGIPEPRQRKSLTQSYPLKKIVSIFITVEGESQEVNAMCLLQCPLFHVSNPELIYSANIPASLLRGPSVSAFLSPGVIAWPSMPIWVFVWVLGIPTVVLTQALSTQSCLLDPIY